MKAEKYTNRDKYLVAKTKFSQALADYIENKISSKDFEVSKNLYITETLEFMKNSGVVGWFDVVVSERFQIIKN